MSQKFLQPHDPPTWPPSVFPPSSEFLDWTVKKVAELIIGKKRKDDDDD